jgi:GT2 family glycosyltransferase
MGEGLVSVIIPTYNRARCLAKAVDSVLGQTHGEVDVIVVDDGSTDETGDMVRDTYGSDGRVRYVRQDNRGVSAARNHGIRLVKGDFAGLLDSDDVWKPFKLELQLACLRAFPDAGMVWSDMTAVGTGGEVIAEKYLTRFYGNYSRFPRDVLFDRSLPVAEVAPRLAEEARGARVYAGEIYAPMAMGNLVHTSTVLLRRERLAASGFFDETVRSGEDHEFHLATCRAGPVAFVDVPTILYEVGAADALTGRGFRVSMASQFLSTLTRALDRDGSRIRARIPEHVISEVLGEAHLWVGESLLRGGKQREARGHFLRSLRTGPKRRRAARLYLAALLPPEVEERIRQAYWVLKRRV